MKKRFIAWCLILAMCVILVPPIIVQAEETPKLSVGSVTTSGNIGDTVEIPITLSGNTGLNTMMFKVYYDSAVLSYVSEKVGSGFANEFINDNLDNTSDDYSYYTFMLDVEGASDLENGILNENTENGVITTLTFEIVGDIGSGTELEIITDSADNLDGEGNEVTITTENGTVTVAEVGEPDVPKIVVGSAKGKAGDTVDVTVSIENNLGFAGMDFDIIYDNTKLDLIAVTNDLGKEICVNSDVDTYENKCTFVYAGLNNVEGDGVLTTLTFEIIDGTEEGTAEISINMKEGTQFYYQDYNEIEFEVTTVNGSVTIYEYIIGDANDDGVVNNRDAARILQYLAGWNVTINLDASDANADGTVNNRDAARILQYLAGWNVDLG